MTARLLERNGALPGPDEGDRVSAALDLGRATSGVWKLDAIALLELLDAGRGAAGRRLRDALADGSVAGALALPPVPGQPPGRTVVLQPRRPDVVVVPREAPGFSPGGGPNVVLDLVASDGVGAIARERADALDGPAWEVDTGDAAPRATVELGSAAVAPLARAHVRHAAYLAGAAGALVDATRDRVDERRQFGVRIAEFQAVAFAVAGHAARWAAVRAHVDDLAAAPPDAPAAARLLAGAGDLAVATASDLVVLHGAHGLTGASPAQRLYRHLGLVACRWGTPRALRAYARRLGYR